MAAATSDGVASWPACDMVDMFILASTSVTKTTSTKVPAGIGIGIRGRCRRAKPESCGCSESCVGCTGKDDQQPASSEHAWQVRAGSSSI